MSDKDNLTPKILLEGLYNILKNNGERLDEKAVSKAQQRFMGMVHAAQKGEKAASPKIAKVAKSMGKKDAKDFAKTKHKGLPNKVKAECGEPDQMTDEELKMFSRHNVGKRSGRGQGDNPWNHLKSRGRKFKGRTRNEDVDVEECAGVGIITNQNSTKDVNKKTPQKNLDAFHLEEALFDMYNTLTEGGTHPLGDAAKASIKGAITTPDANNNAGDAYKSWRFGIALAGAPEYPTKAVNDIGGDPLITAYTDEERKMVQYAAQQADVGHLKNLTSNKSAEKPDVNKLSAISPAKRNKYGI
jgi:hypothetical protein